MTKYNITCSRLLQVTVITKHICFEEEKNVVFIIVNLGHNVHGYNLQYLLVLESSRFYNMIEFLDSIDA